MVRKHRSSYVTRETGSVWISFLSLTSLLVWTPDLSGSVGRSLGSRLLQCSNFYFTYWKDTLESLCSLWSTGQQSETTRRLWKQPASHSRSHTFPLGPVFLRFLRCENWQKKNYTVGTHNTYGGNGLARHVTWRTTFDLWLLVTPNYLREYVIPKLGSVGGLGCKTACCNLCFSFCFCHFLVPNTLHLNM